MGIDDRFAAQLRDDRQTLPRGPAFGLRAATVGDVRDALGVTEQRFEPAARIGALLASDLLPVIAPERCIRRCVHRTRYTLLGCGLHRDHRSTGHVPWCEHWPIFTKSPQRMK
jgi:hypothetical protein